MSGAATAMLGAQICPRADDRLSHEAHKPAALGFDWTAREGELERLARFNALRTLLTCGVYHFWGKVALRRHLWASVSLDGRPFAYTGTVRDLLVPALVGASVIVTIVGGFIVMKLLAITLPRPRPTPWRLVFTVPVVLVIGWHMWRARAYLLEHTVWCGKAGALRGDPKPYALLHMLTAIATPLSLGWVLPWRQMAMSERIWSATELAGARFSFRGNRRALYLRFAFVWIAALLVYFAALVVLTIAMGPKIVAASQSWTVPDLTLSDIGVLAALLLACLVLFTALFSWYRARLLDVLAYGMEMDGRRFALRLSDGAFVRLCVENTLMKVLSLGLLSGLAEIRLIRHIVQRLELGGNTPGMR